MAQTKAQLVVGLNVNASAPASALQIDASGNVNLDSNTLYVDATNNRVGIGTSSPAQLLSLAGTSANILLSGTSNSYTTYNINASNIGYVGDANWMFGGISSNFGVRATSSLVFGIGASECARIDNSGRLIVGTNATFDQSARLQVRADTGTSVAANFYSYGADNSQLVIGAARGTPAIPSTLNSTDTIGGVYFRGNDGTSFKTGAQILAQIDNITPSNDLPSRLVFSTTADGASSPTERMRISQNGAHDIYSSNYGLATRVSATAGTSTAIYFGSYGATSTGTGTIAYQVWSNGNVQNTNNSYTAISDIKLKENIVDANSQWDDIKALQVRNYNLKEGQTHKQIGLIAQEVEPISPGLVYESPDRDEDGNDLGTVTKSVNYSVLYMKAVKALQEAMERIEQLETEMAAVKAQLS